MIKIEPIGFLHCEQKERYEVPKQGVFTENHGIIKLNPHCNFEQAVKHLSGFERLWLIYHFHINNNWKPLVRPPIYFKEKIGVFATRSPFRPNPIGMSCVKLEKVDGLKIYISNFDLLDQTPILDIKPYLPYSDSFPDSKTGWVEDKSNDAFSFIFSDNSEKQMDEILKSYDINIKNYIKVQLQFEPGNTFRKRISETENTHNGAIIFSLSFREWYVNYIIEHSNKQVEIIDVKKVVSKSREDALS